MWNLVSWSIEKRAAEITNTNAICYYDDAERLADSDKIALLMVNPISLLTLMGPPTRSAKNLVQK